MKKKIRALVVDDTAFMRRALVEILSSHHDIDVVGVASHGKEALDAVDTLDPDVITLDVDMPVMDGLTTIKHLMVRKPRPVIMVSGMADQGRVTFEALRLGAVDFFQKPSGTISLDMKDAANELSQVVRLAAGLNIGAIRRVRMPGRGPSPSSTPGRTARLVLIFAMDGACGSFIRMMSVLDSNMPMAVAAFQNVSHSVLRSYADEFNKVACWDIRANEGGRLEAGKCYVAGFGHSWTLRVSGYACGLDLAGDEQSPDIFLEDCAEQYGADCMAVILGGATNPAPQGLEAVKKCGGIIRALAPDASVCGAAAREMLNSGIVDTVCDEIQLRREIQTFVLEEKIGTITR